MNPTLNNILSTTLSTEELIDALRTSESITEGLMALLDEAESAIARVRDIETSDTPYPSWLTGILYRIFNQLAENLLKKTYKHIPSVEKEWIVIEEEKIDAEDFVLV